MLSIFRSSVAQTFLLSREGITAHRKDVVAETAGAVIAVRGASSRGFAAAFALPFFKTDHASGGAWLADVRELLPADLLVVLYL